jgi:Tfp pilus assembly protein PilE
MGQQQLLLIILGVIIVGIAVSVAITIFNDNLISSNRDQIQNDLLFIASKAQEFYATPASRAGGGHSFSGITADATGIKKLVSQEFIDNNNGTYSVRSAGSSTTVQFQGVGKVQLPDGSYPTYSCRVRTYSFSIRKRN